MSVWASVETLEAFVWKTAHAKVYQRKNEFFETHDAPHFVMWWVEDGHVPTLAEANEKLEQYRQHGPSDAARWPMRIRPQATLAPPASPWARHPNAECRNKP